MRGGKIGMVSFDSISAKAEMAKRSQILLDFKYQLPSKKVIVVKLFRVHVLQTVSMDNIKIEVRYD